MSKRKRVRAEDKVWIRKLRPGAQPYLMEREKARALMAKGSLEVIYDANREHDLR